MMNTMMQDLNKHKIVAICRGVSTENILDTAKALYDGGIRFMEVTFNQKAADPIIETAASIKLLTENMGDKMYFGAGTVLTPQQVDSAIDAGAKYIISPNFSVDVVKRTVERGAISMPGCLTPSEVVNAYDAGAHIIKLFPAGNLGVGYIKAVMAPISHIPLMAVGGINAANMSDFLKLGIMGLGIGGNLVDTKLIAEGKFDEITKIALTYTSQI